MLLFNSIIFMTINVLSVVLVVSTVYSGTVLNCTNIAKKFGTKLNYIRRNGNSVKTWDTKMFKSCHKNSGLNILAYWTLMFTYRYTSISFTVKDRDLLYGFDPSNSYAKILWLYIRNITCFRFYLMSWKLNKLKI